MADDFLANLSASLTGDFFGASRQVGADQSFVTPRLAGTQPTNAIDAMQPIQPAASGDAYGWLNDMRDIVKTTAGYLIAKDAQKNNVAPPQVYERTAAQAAGMPSQSGGAANGGLLLIGVVVVGVVLLLKD